MNIDRHADARDFLQHSEAWLLQSEPENNLILGIARRYSDTAPDRDSKIYWATLRNGSQIVGASFRTPPHLLSVSAMPSAAIPLLVEDAARVFPDLPGVVGPADVAEQFVQLWTKEFGGTWRVKLRQRIHVLTAVEKIPEVIPGSLRRIEPSDRALITKWMKGFVRDTGVLGPARSIAKTLLKSRKAYFWEDAGPRSMVAAVRDTPHGACVNAVYTPPKFRRQGYATAAVAAVSEMLLATGKEFCCLYTDLANPTSNSIYRKIGYRPVRDDVELVIESDSDS